MLLAGYSGMAIFALRYNNEDVQYMSSTLAEQKQINVVEEYTYNRAYINILSGATFNNATIYPMLEKTDDETARPYQRYGDVTYKINSLGDNKQLFDGNFRQGNETSTLSKSLVFSLNSIPCIKGKYYTISTNIDLKIYKYAIFVNTNKFPTSNPNSNNTGWKTEKAVTIKPTANGYIGIIVSHIDNSIFTPEDIKQYYFKVEEGETATSYSPYGQGSTEINVVNKNLAEKIDGMWYSGATKILYADAQGYGYIARIKENSKITISKKNAGNRFVVCLTKEKPVANMSCDITEFPDATTRTEYSFNNTDYKWLFFGYYRGTDVEEAKKAGENVQIEIGDKTNYEEHKEQKIVLDIQQEMLTGDYIDLDRKKEVHGWNKYIFTGNETFTSATSGGTQIYRTTMFSTELKKDDENVIVLCNNAKGVTNKTWTSNADKDIVFGGTNGLIQFIVKEVVTLEEFKAKLQELYNLGTPVEIYYKTAEVTELDLTESQIEVSEKLNKLRFYKNVNNIFTLEDIALLQATYSVDLKSYINANKEN